MKGPWGAQSKWRRPWEKGNSGVILSEKRLLAERQKAEEGRDREEDVIVISDEEQEGQESFGLVESFMAEQDVNFLSRGAGADGLKESSLVRCSSVRSFEGNVSAQNVLQVGEQVDLVDQEGVLVTGLVYGQVGSFVNRDKGKVLLDRRKPALQEVSAGCDAPRFPGRPGGLTVHQDAGRHAGGQSFPVKARAPLIHRKEGRVNSGAVYLTTRETVVRGSLGHGAGSVLENEQPSTSWGAGASFERLERLEETMLDYDDDEDDQDTRVAAPVLQSTVPEVVQGDHSGIRRRASAGNLPRGELGMGMGRIVGGNYGREVCGFGGVDASVQVDDIKEDGAGKSEVTGDVREEDGSKVLQESVQAGGVVGAEVSVALAQAIQPIKHHLLGFAEQQGWVPQSSSQEELQFSQDTGSSSVANSHQVDFEQLVQALNKEHGYSPSQSLHLRVESKGDSDASSSSNSLDRDSDSPWKRKAKSRHSSVSSQPLKVLTFEPEDIVHPRSSSWAPPFKVAEYVQARIRHCFDKDVRSRLRSECPRPDFPSKVTETPEVDPTLVTYSKKFSKDPKEGIDRAWRDMDDDMEDSDNDMDKDDPDIMIWSGPVEKKHKKFS
ncbi:hypothetical protein NDU88_004294 [Pleurodeles waltl]|uniref:Uncharacterized protein n=1 Tax=Pleurodeles waltl TaxID=8319 RepID=A0AAV7T786_PLEWA|nr:hypothetical protein NDU88_004294 [Pleurodeles waltl]